MMGRQAFYLSFDTAFLRSHNVVSLCRVCSLNDYHYMPIVSYYSTRLLYSVKSLLLCQNLHGDEGYEYEFEKSIHEERDRLFYSQVVNLGFLTMITFPNRFLSVEKRNNLTRLGAMVDSKLNFTFCSLSDSSLCRWPI
jgi:hypothetical protein